LEAPRRHWQPAYALRPANFNRESDRGYALGRWEAICDNRCRTISWGHGAALRPLSSTRRQQSESVFLADEARTVKHLTQFADEIRQLTIEDVCLFSPDRPEDGMIYFNGSDEFRVWRCDYVALKRRRLGFDS